MLHNCLYHALITRSTRGPLTLDDGDEFFRYSSHVSGAFPDFYDEEERGAKSSYSKYVPVNTTPSNKERQQNHFLSTASEASLSFPSIQLPSLDFLSVFLMP
ncbi:hypothetical protein VNO80_28590 [Phaseolus coccineus]|uniref:Uncharacterized protein n=1 Tax=Phaseolus coccineus TaxID=3886 RepID=A0AAN9QE56_PHACN